VVDAGDDQVRALAEQPEVGEADAVDGGAVGGEAAGAVAELDLFDLEWRAGRDAAGRRAAVAVRGDHVDLEPVDVQEGAPESVEPAGGNAVVVGEQDLHPGDSRVVRGPSTAAAPGRVSATAVDGSTDEILSPERNASPLPAPLLGRELPGPETP
jgi:hypothetical protein